MAKQRTENPVVAVVTNDNIQITMHVADQAAPEDKRGKVVCSVNIETEGDRDNDRATVFPHEFLADYQAFVQALKDIRDQALTDLGYQDAP